MLLDYNKNIKIVDFGLSNTYKEGELLKTACGSPCYAAPEMIAGKKYDGLSVDIWSCGVILFALLCGYLPFEDKNTSVLYKKILDGAFHIPRFVGQEARDLLKRILVTDPDKRIKVSEIRAHPWFLGEEKSGLDLPSAEQGLMVGYNHIPIDEEILRQIEEFGFNPELT